jgi:hypothetical protein
MVINKNAHLAQKIRMAQCVDAPSPMYEATSALPRFGVLRTSVEMGTFNGACSDFRRFHPTDLP